VRSQQKQQYCVQHHRREERITKDGLCVFVRRPTCPSSCADHQAYESEISGGSGCRIEFFFRDSLQLPRPELRIRNRRIYQATVQHEYSTEVRPITQEWYVRVFSHRQQVLTKIWPHVLDVANRELTRRPQTIPP
jgi:hypothetical protein